MDAPEIDLLLMAEFSDVSNAKMQLKKSALDLPLAQYPVSATPPGWRRR
jgi:hypothetical protein